MAKASPSRTSFNAGEFSILVEGRIDIDRYPASMRTLRNFIAAPQGPAIRRSGTQVMAEAYTTATNSFLVPFEFSEVQSQALEFAEGRIRFLSEAGLQTYAPITAGIVVTQKTPMIFGLSGLNANVGDEVAFANGDPALALNGITANIVSKAGDYYTLDINFLGEIGDHLFTTARVYHIVNPFASVYCANLRYLQSLDVLYLFCEPYQPRKLTRYASYNWVFELFDYPNGPFMNEDPYFGKLTLSATGTIMTAGTITASGSGTGDAQIQKTGGAHTVIPENAFDQDNESYWESSNDQTGWIRFQFAAPKIITGYVIYMARSNSSTDYTATDYAPGDFTFEGSTDGTTWVVLDRQKEYVLYEVGRSVWFKFLNTQAYAYYRLNVEKCTRNGTVKPRINRLEMTEEVGQIVTLTVSGDYSRLNRGDGFGVLEGGRVLRIKDIDTFYRLVKVVSRISATQVTVQLLNEPFSSSSLLPNWAPAIFSEATGWPIVATFFEDRMWSGGSREFPDLVVGSRTGNYEDYAQRTPTNVVLDDSAIVVRLNSRRMSRIKWLETDERGLLIGTGVQEYVINSSKTTDEAITARAIKGRSSTARGSSFVDPVKIDRQILYVTRSQRTVREYTYVFEADGYKSPSMSLFASHLGLPKFMQMAYAAEPHSIIWFRREDGSVVGLTYNREENVIGWHQHDFGGIVRSIITLPSANLAQDVLWMVVDRGSKRVIERLMPFWDFGNAVESSHYVDSGLRYVGEEATRIYGLNHLAGMQVDGLIDGVPFAELLTVDAVGSVTLPYAGSNVIVGVPFESFAETSRIEAGAADGTAQGKTKRIHNVTASLWDSAYGEVARYNDDPGEGQNPYEWQDVTYKEAYDDLEPVQLQTGMFGPIILGEGYDKRGSISFRQTRPLPFNVVSLLPQMFTQDR